MTVLCVVAHPDDECFMGASLARFVAEGHLVYVGALADGETSRIKATVTSATWVNARTKARYRKQVEAARVLGYRMMLNGSLPDQRLDGVDLLDLTRIIEGWIVRVKPSVVYTHSGSDLNADHRRVYEAVLPAVRPKNGVQAVYAFAGPRMLGFEPTAFWNVTGYVDQQLAAMSCYGDELAGEVELVKARAVDCGYRVGVEHAEGFEVVRILQ